MLRTSSLRNRRSFTALKLLGELAGTGIVLGEPDAHDPKLREAQRAMTIAYAANNALDLVIETAGKGRRVYKAMTAEDGAAASLFLGHAVTAIQARLASSPRHHLSVDRLNEARDLLRRYFPWSDSDDAEVAELAGLVDVSTGEGKEDADLRAAFGAVARILGGAAADLPGFVAVSGGGELADSYTAGISWSICFNHVGTTLLERTDPAGLAAFRMRS